MDDEHDLFATFSAQPLTACCAARVDVSKLWPVALVDGMRSHGENDLVRRVLDPVTA
jgi:hypothetical protein